jgi:EAL domain-containing protein (putative c-di-GMP-specific phosphodiesterase class I)
MQVSQTELSVTLSIGCAHHSADCDSLDTLLWRADLARRHARERGLTLVEYDDALQPPARRLDLSLRADLRQAVVNEQFVLRYQPQVRPATGELVGFEALIRWPHPRTGREVSPAEFIPYVEATSYIHPVTRWVLDRALADLASLEDGAQLSMAVNISAKNLLHDGFVPMVRAALARHGVAPHRLELELTESSFLTSPQTARQQVEALSALGVRVSIDDFGTGYSSLSYLQDLPVHAIKVDQSFVRPMRDTARSATIVRVAVELAHALGMAAVAEGVESPELVPRLAQMGYDAVQGYAIARPLPLQEALRAGLAWGAAAPASTPA